MNEVYSKGSKGNCITNKSDVYYIDDIWSLDILYIKAYGPEKKERIRISFSSNRQFLKFWLNSSPQKNAQTIKDSFENIITISKRKPHLSKLTVEKIFTILFFRISEMTIALNNILEIHTETKELFLQKNLIELTETYLNDLFLKRVMVIGLILYNQ